MLNNHNEQNIAMVSFVLKNTLSEHGGVTRGICSINQDGYLQNIMETHNIEKDDKGAFVRNDNEKTYLNINLPVSMNMWALYPEIFDILDREFQLFLDQLDKNDLKSEYLLPTIIGELLAKQQINVKVLESYDNWFGVTYKEDKQLVIKKIQQLIADKAYM